eukprot:618909-Lingulodinium_polyedra.AAC.1
MCRSLLRQLIVWAAFVVEDSPWLMEAPTDALQAPIPFGNKRARVIDRRLKEAVAEASASGDLSGTAPAVFQSMRRLGIKKLHLKRRTAQLFHKER